MKNQPYSLIYQRVFGLFASILPKSHQLTSDGSPICDEFVKILHSISIVDFVQCT